MSWSYSLFVASCFCSGIYFLQQTHFSPLSDWMKHRAKAETSDNRFRFATPSVIDYNCVPSEWMFCYRAHTRDSFLCVEGKRANRFLKHPTTQMILYVKFWTLQLCRSSAVTGDVWWSECEIYYREKTWRTTEKMFLYFKKTHQQFKKTNNLRFK